MKAEPTAGLPTVHFERLDGTRGEGVRWTDGPRVRGYTAVTWMRVDGLFVLTGMRGSRGDVRRHEILSIQPAQAIEVSEEGDVSVRG